MASERTRLATPLGTSLLMELEDHAWENSAITSDAAGSFALGSNSGPVRQRNDDRVAIAQFDTRGLPGVTVLIVMDGVGSTARGNAAAAVGLAAIVESFANARKSSLSNMLKNALLHADQEVFRVLQGEGLTTASVVAIGAHGDWRAVNVGDSRIFGWDAGLRTIEQLTQDDTLENELRRNKIEAGEMLKLRGLDGSLSRALGEPRSPAEPLDLEVLELSSSGLVLASDGAWHPGQVSVNQVAAQARSATELVERMLQANSWFGGRDNVSMIAAEDVKLLTRPTAFEPGDPGRIRIWTPYGKSTFVVLEKGAASAVSPRKQKRSTKKEPVPRDIDDSGASDRYPAPQAGTSVESSLKFEEG